MISVVTDRSVRAWKRLATCGAIVLAVAAQPSSAQDKPAAEPVSCAKLAPPLKVWLDKTVGIDGCRILSSKIVLNARGKQFRRLEIGLSGTVGGWAVVKRQLYSTSFTDAPDIVFDQLGVTGPRFRGIARYEADKGAGLTLFLPVNAADWNGKLFVTAHGGHSYAGVGTLVPRAGAPVFHPFANVNKYAGLLIDKGYAVAHTRRSSDIAPDQGDMTVTLENGRTVTGYQVAYHGGLMTTWALMARNIIRQRLGRPPKQIYFYGFASGAMVGRLLNYQPGLNDDGEGHPVFGGILADDPAFGLWLPILRKDGRDTLFTDAASRARFVKQIDVAHQLYHEPEHAPHLDTKRRNAALLRAKGLGDRHRFYEIRGVSHYDAGFGPKDWIGRRDLTFQNLDLTPVISALIDHLDAWVDKGKAPPATRSDDKSLGGIGDKGEPINRAIALPPVACPLGVYFVYPPELGDRPVGLRITGFAAFDGVNLEPLDGRGRLVDMNGNGKRDKRESVVQAWRRLGLVAKNEGFTRLVYTSCVTRVSEGLAKNGLIVRGAELYYKRRAPMILLPQGAR